ncbi:MULTISPECIES: flagellar assembly protein T N-terminal domain-containing protein [Vibrio]|uniref:Flagellar assembly protein T N-terminal domain-containing protein n=1 Tax=Vibrio cortegadensis TaxID=1328770 RepID=A0ABV4M3G7_9VIBR
MLSKKWFTFFSALIISYSSQLYADPMDDVFELIEYKSGTRVGYDSAHGYYIVSLAKSTNRNQEKAHKAALKLSLDDINHLLNQITIANKESSRFNGLSLSKTPGNDKFNRKEFTQAAVSTLRSNPSSYEEIKSGKYDDSYFVSLIISEKTVAGTNWDNPKELMDASDFDFEVESVESKGTAPLINSENSARQIALLDAFTNAVQQSKGFEIASQKDSNGNIVSTAMTPKIAGYISSYELLDEDIEKGVYYVIIDAYVDSEKVANDVSFYSGLMKNPIFNIRTSDSNDSSWITDQLETLGFSLNNGKTAPTHTFNLKKRQNEVENHKGKIGYETELTLQFTDQKTGNILFTIRNTPKKTRVFTDSKSRSKHLSQVQAQKALEGKLAKEIIQALSKQIKA